MRHPDAGDCAGARVELQGWMRTDGNLKRLVGEWNSPAIIIMVNDFVRSQARRKLAAPARSAFRSNGGAAD